MDAKKAQRAALKLLLKELKDGQAKVGGEGWDQTQADALDAKVEEADALQKEILAYDASMKALNATLDAGSQVADPVLPNDDQPDPDPVPAQRKQRQHAHAFDGNPVGGFMSLGNYFVAQQTLRDFIAKGAPKAQELIAEVPMSFLRGGQQYVPLSEKQIKGFYEMKAVPTIGTSPVVIEPTLLPDLVRVTENDTLRLRDVLNISTTTSDAVKYTRLTSYTRAAATVANSAQKPESTLALDAVTEAVRTLAVWMPVEEQQLSDYPALAGIINGELLYDVEKHVEELVMYGDGAGENFNGIIPDAAVLAARVVALDTFIDISRRAVTDVRRAGYEPNAILIDPLDWEEIVLEKGTDNRYVWVVVTEGATQRLWAVPVIETVAMEGFAGDVPEARNMLVGDFLRGATLWDRERSSISVGFINDQFIRNQRTILAEMRAAFGVRRPGAFRKHETQAANSS